MKRNGMGKYIPFILVLELFGLMSGNSTHGGSFRSPKSDFFRTQFPLCNGNSNVLPFPA